jgi:hypothetical protein
MSNRASQRKPSETSLRLCVYLRVAALCAGTALAGGFAIQPAFALSEIKREELPAPGQTAPDSTTSTPSPDATTPPASTAPDATTPAMPGQATDPDPNLPGGEDAAEPGDTLEPDATEPADTVSPMDESGEETPNANEPIPEVQYDFTQLPAPVKALRDQLLEAAKSGDIQKLRPLIGQGDDQTQLSLAGIEGDPIDYLKGLAGDEDGQEILAILEEVITAGYVHLDPGTDEELYVWPYFFAIPLDKLTGPQRVELFKLVTAGDYEEMKTYGSYIFYRVGITPQGRWAFFVAGE